MNNKGEGPGNTPIELNEFNLPIYYLHLARGFSITFEWDVDFSPTHGCCKLGIDDFLNHKDKPGLKVNIVTIVYPLYP